MTGDSCTEEDALDHLGPRAPLLICQEPVSSSYRTMNVCMSAASDSEQSRSLHATPVQLEALQTLEASLTCHLCQGLVNQPVSLGCGHFFCYGCINKHAENNWGCPTCSMPVTMTRKDGRSFVQLNPQLKTLVEALSDIEKALQKAPDQWWTYKLPKDGDSQDQKAPRERIADRTVKGVESDDDTVDDLFYATREY